MTIREQLLDRLAAPRAWGYQHDGHAATEPTATAALALLCAGRTEAAGRALDWLVRVQAADGSLGVTASEATPAWPTALAVLAYTAAGTRYDARRKQAIGWLLDTKGTPIERTEQLGHDSTLVGWPWVTPTHSWSEPTALAVLALKAAGHRDHPRCREATRLLVDRLLPDGGCNYGNTRVLGQMLRPHLMPSGVALWALAGEDSHDSATAGEKLADDKQRIAHSLDYLEQQLAQPISAAALAYTTLALSSHGRPLDAVHDALAMVASRHLHAKTKTVTKTSPWKLALLALTALELDPVADCPRPSAITGGVVSA